MSKLKPHKNHLYHRNFLSVFFPVILFVLGLLPLTGCRPDAEAPISSDTYTYKVVPNWPQLPPGFTFTKVTGIATDSAGRIYAAGGKQNPILIFSPEGKYLGSWGGDTIKLKHGLRIHNDHVWVTDVENHQVYQFTLDGRLLREFGTRGVPGQGQNQFNRPSDIAFAPNGDIYISDGYGNSRVVCLAPDGSFKNTWGTKGSEPGQFDLVHGIATDDQGRVYVADRNNRRIQVFTSEGRFLRQWRHVGKPFSFYITADRKIFVTDGKEEGPERVLILDTDGNILATFGQSGPEPGQFKMCHSVHVTDKGEVYIAEAINNRIQKFVPAR